MTPGGHVTLGVQSSTLVAPISVVPDVTVKSGAVIDVSGGWVTYQAGWVQTTDLIDAAGNIVNIGDADPNDTFIGIYTGDVEYQPRWGVSQTYSNPLLFGSAIRRPVHRRPRRRIADDQRIGECSTAPSTPMRFPDRSRLRKLKSATPSPASMAINAIFRGRRRSCRPAVFCSCRRSGRTRTDGVIHRRWRYHVVGQADYQPVSSSLGYGQSVSIDANGNLVVPTRDPALILPQARIDTITLSADAISNMGLSDLSLETSGQIDVAQDANVSLAPGGVFNAEAGRTITIDGNISVPSGTIALQTIDLGNWIGLCAGGELNSDRSTSS